MRPPIDRLRVHYFLVKLGIDFYYPARLYLVGGTTLVYEGLRQQSLDIDISYEVADEHEAEFARVIRRLKDEMQINIELASPGDFIPLPSGWKERAKFVGRFGQVDVFHFDLYSTALSKIERGREGDYEDVLAMLRTEQINFDELSRAFQNILPRLERESLKRDPEKFKRNFAALQARHTAL
ncbi:MAG: DUF6036 family nucleotidyltransferase [Chloroflexi bacterium]|nr:DUF6036 family nucleotidyltransferase [Chloroflexota bacterium]MCL5274797.1 DUF6036 family nucleotidyltransferase [Chloroflexota bacterium]